MNRRKLELFIIVSIGSISSLFASPVVSLPVSVPQKENRTTSQLQLLKQGGVSSTTALKNETITLSNGLVFDEVGHDKGFKEGDGVEKLEPLNNFISGEFAYLAVVPSGSTTSFTSGGFTYTSSIPDSTVYFGSSSLSAGHELNVVIVNKTPAYIVPESVGSVNSSSTYYVVFGNKRLGPYEYASSLTNVDEHLYFLARFSDGGYLMDENGKKIKGPISSENAVFVKIVAYQGKPTFTIQQKVTPYEPHDGDLSLSDAQKENTKGLGFFGGIRHFFTSFFSKGTINKNSIRIVSDSVWTLSSGSTTIATTGSPSHNLFVDPVSGELAYQRSYYEGGIPCGGIVSQNKWLVKVCDQTIYDFFGFSNGVVGYTNASSAVVVGTTTRAYPVPSGQGTSYNYFLAGGNLITVTRPSQSSKGVDILYENTSILADLHSKGLSLASGISAMDKDEVKVINDKLVLKVVDDKGYIFFLVQK